MSQFNQMGMQSMGQRSTPPLPMGASGNQVRAEHTNVLFSMCQKTKLRIRQIFIQWLPECIAGFFCMYVYAYQNT